MKKFDLRAIMEAAWKLFRKATNLAFGECLHRAWLSAKAKEVNEKRIEDAKQAAGVTDLIWGSKGDGAIYKARFFGRSQVQEAALA